jgi:hypothetical protein
MTSTPESAPVLAGAPGFPDAASGGGDGIDVLCLGRLRPASAAWLLVTAADGLAGASALTCPWMLGPYGGEVRISAAVPAIVGGTSRSSWRASPWITSACPAAPWRRA